MELKNKEFILSERFMMFNEFRIKLKNESAYVLRICNEKRFEIAKKINFIIENDPEKAENIRNDEGYCPPGYNTFVDNIDNIFRYIDYFISKDINYYRKYHKNCSFRYSNKMVEILLGKQTDDKTEDYIIEDSYEYDLDEYILCFQSIGNDFNIFEICISSLVDYTNIIRIPHKKMESDEYYKTKGAEHVARKLIYDHVLWKDNNSLNSSFALHKKTINEEIESQIIKHK